MASRDEDGEKAEASSESKEEAAASQGREGGKEREGPCRRAKGRRGSHVVMQT